MNILSRQKHNCFSLSKIQPLHTIQQFMEEEFLVQGVSFSLSVTSKTTQQGELILLYRVLSSEGKHGSRLHKSSVSHLYKYVSHFNYHVLILSKKELFKKPLLFTEQVWKVRLRWWWGSACWRRKCQSACCELYIYWKYSSNWRRSYV